MAEQNVPTHGSFAWNELATNDVAACKSFYTDLLGWEAEDMPMGDGTYTVFKKGSQQLAGMMAIAPEWGPVPPNWMGYIAVDDVDEAASRVEGLGGGVIMPPTDIPNIGRFAVIKDPGGAVVSIMTFLPME
ncbi:MAG: VOC family protein [Bacteroidia bacterium]|nr:VOC family protein [Bacteroidia bacterium]